MLKKQFIGFLLIFALIISLIVPVDATENIKEEEEKMLSSTAVLDDYASYIEQYDSINITNHSIVIENAESSPLEAEWALSFSFNVEKEGLPK